MKPNIGFFMTTSASTLRDMFTDGELGDFFVSYTGRPVPSGVSGLDVIDEIKRVAYARAK